MLVQNVTKGFAKSSNNIILVWHIIPLSKADLTHNQAAIEQNSERLSRGRRYWFLLYICIYTLTSTSAEVLNLFVNANISLANYMATQCIEACRHDQDNLLKFKLTIKMGKKSTLNNFECGMVVSARLVGLSVSQSADPLGFFHTTSLEFTENGPTPPKISIE